MYSVSSTIPTVREYNILKSGHENSIFYSVAEKFSGYSEKKALREFATLFVGFLDRVREQTPQFQKPYTPIFSENKQYFFCQSSDFKVVSDYTRLNFNEIQDISIYDYWSWLHDAIVWDCSQSKSGLEYLEKCYHKMQREPDRDGIREFLAKG